MRHHASEDLHYTVRKCSLKTFIVTGVGIIEGVLWFVIKINNEISKLEWEQVQTFTTHTFDDAQEQRRIRLVMEQRLSPPTDVEMTFDAMCKKAESKKLLGVGTDVYKALNHLRKLRNKVHLHSLAERLESDWHSFSTEKVELMKTALHSVLTSPQFAPSQKEAETIAFLMVNKVS